MEFEILIDYPSPYHNPSFFSIQNTYVPDTSSIDDKIVWCLTSDGLYTTKYVNTFLDSNEDSSVHNSNKNFNWIWKIKAPNKIKLFIWLLYHKKLPTNQYLNLIGMNMSFVCTFCETANETINHIIFYYCNVKLF
ncbi:hypothetical protein R3W88_016213 [Solanum pinnatisectum]|uniref:Reverse transcriptase zinc-binding domain-containing protein n=1 Tax=Solanum pinnatisectum TaxID=50273 RepID=A0AAV9KZV8_9SOLN|nr:hypothetical protein R3W88_016213 [Solanum pinnatisectum]